MNKDTNTRINELAAHHDKPVGEIVSSTFKDLQVAITNDGLVIWVSADNLPLKERFLKDDFNIDLTILDDVLEFNLWSKDGVITPRAITVRSSLIVADGAHRELLAFEVGQFLNTTILAVIGESVRSLKSFPLSPEMSFAIVGACVLPAMENFVSRKQDLFRFTDKDFKSGLPIGQFTQKVEKIGKF